MWHNKYIGIPYQEKGRSLEGADCWGLSRLIYKNEFDIDLPSFSDNYAHEDTERIAELMIQYREGWEETNTYKSGDMILFRVLGHVSHIGVMINDTQFIHSRQGQDAAIDSLSTSRWTHRIAGVYTYSENSKEVMQKQPIAFSAIHANFTSGMNLGEILKQVIEDNKIPLSMESQVMIFIDGEAVTSITDKNLVPKEDQIIEYRLVPGKDALKIVLIIAIAYYAPMLAGELTGFTSATTAAGIMGGQVTASLAFANFAATAVISLIGMTLVNAIFPVRPPEAIPDAGSSNPQLMFTGARNTANQYQAIPVVLGQYRIVAPCAAVNYLTVNTDTSFLKMLLTWGYGPVDVTDMRVGATLLTDYKLADDSALPALKTVYGLSSETETDLNLIYKVYGPDTYQQSPNIELINDGVNPSTGVYTGVNTTTGIWQTYNITSLVNNVSLSLHFPEGLRGLCREGENAGNPFAVAFTGVIEYIEISQTTLAEVGTWTTIPLGYGAAPTYTAEEGPISTYFEGDWTTTMGIVSVLDANEQPFYLRKDAFTVTIDLKILSPIPKFYKVRIRRTNREGELFATELDSAGNKPVYFHKAIVYLITGTNSTAKAVKYPVNTKLALTAINIQATSQLNGSIDGINALVTSRCLDYDIATSTWIEKPTRNPASLFRYILQHPANAQRISSADAAAEIDLAYLAIWWARCNTNGYTYDAVISSQKSILDTLKDICAAGRASPLLLGGKWTVVEDIPRTTVVQHFAPHNSWGFEGSKKLSVMPHALRITFINSEKEYQSEELMVYNDGYGDIDNGAIKAASIFEAIQLPGITKPSLIHKHGRFHLAQAKLRPEIYTINTDMEYLVCNRGDLVRVSHDIPMWGTGTGRVRTYTSPTILELDEPISLSANIQYVIRIRTETGITVLRNIEVSALDRINATTISLTTSVTGVEGKADNLYMIGQSNLESAELIVLTIEPSANLTAKITLVDYSPAVYTADSLPIPAFDTKITLPSLFARNFITSVPIVDTLNIKSDESVMELSGSTYIYKLAVPYTNPATLTNNITHVEARLCLTNDVSTSWRTNKIVLISAGSFLFSDLMEHEHYSLQLRYVSGEGYMGPWSTIINHISIVGRTTPPGLVATPITVVADGDNLRLTWIKNKEIDIVGYEVRELNDFWNTTSEAAFIGSSNTCLVTPAAAGISKTWYIKAYDSINLYSTTATPVTYTVAAPSAPTNISGAYSGIVLAQFKWTASLPGTFAVKNYKVSLSGIGITTITSIRDTTDWEVPINWTNAVTLTVTPVDINNNEYTGSANTYVLAISIPTTPAVPILSVSGTDLVLDWADNSVSNSQIPISGYAIYNSDSTLAWKGAVSKANISMIGLSGIKTYTLVAIDFRNQVSSTRSISYTIPKPTSISNGTTLVYTFGNSLTDASLTITWTNVSNNFGLAGYEVSYDSTVLTTNSNTITLSPLPSNWIGDKTFTIKTIDLLGNKSDGIAKIITKAKPNIIVGVTADIIDNNVMLYWALPTRTTLPIDHVIVRKTKIDGVAITPINVGEKSGTFTTIFERQANTYTYEIAAVDTDKQEGPAYSLTATVSQPPDFIFNGSFTSIFSNQVTPNISTVTSGNAKIEVNLDTGVNQVTMPLDLVSTVSQHFDSRSWTTPQNQIDALYPIYSQPSVASGYYEEVIDFGSIIGSSQVTLTATGTVIAGTPVVVTSISHSADNITYSAPSTSTLLFIASFRYVKLSISVSQVSSDRAIYALDYINIRLDSKLKDDAGLVTCSASHTAGTLANFSREFIDVTSIIVSPNSTTPLISVYDFKDTVIPATYSLVINVCTVTTTAAHGFSSAVGAIGQKVRLEFTSGSGISGIYTIASIPSTTQYTVALVTANTSGNVSTYSQGVRVYLYDTSGVRASGAASWAVKGY